MQTRQSPKRATAATRLVTEIKTRSVDSVEFDFINSDLSPQFRQAMRDLKQRTGTIDDYIHNVTSIARRSGSVRSVNFVVDDRNNYDVLFGRPSHLAAFTNEKGVNLKISAFGLYDFFDKASNNLSIRPPLDADLSLPIKCKSLYSYTIPMNLTGSYGFFKASIFKRNAYNLFKRSLTARNSITGAEIDWKNFRISAYQKQYFNDGVRDPSKRLSLSVYNDRLLFDGVGLRLKVGTSRNGSDLSNLAIIRSDQIKYFEYKKTSIFLANTTLIGAASKETFSAKQTQQVYDFANEVQKWNRLLVCNNRIGFSSNVSFVNYSIYLFANLHAHQGEKSRGWSWNYGLGNRFLLAENLAFEVLLNLNNREHEKRVIAKFITF